METGQGDHPRPGDRADPGERKGLVAEVIPENGRNYCLEFSSRNRGRSGMELARAPEEPEHEGELRDPSPVPPGRKPLKIGTFRIALHRK